MSHQHYRHHRVVKRSKICPESCMASYMDYLSDNPLIFLGIALLVVIILKHMFCSHR